MLCLPCFSGHTAQNRHRQGAWSRTSLVGGKRKPHVLFLGLDGAGKTSVLFALSHPPPSGDTLPSTSDSKFFAKEPADEFSNAVCLEGESSARYSDRGGDDSVGKADKASVGIPPEALQSPVAPPPTLKSSFHNLRLGGVDVVAIDTPGRSPLRDTWQDHLPHADVLVLVVDSSDGLRVAVAKQELWRAAAELPEEVAVLVLANKQDLAGGALGAEVLSPAALHAALELDAMPRRSSLRACTARDPAHLEDALEWAIAQAVSRYEVKE